VTQPPVVFVFVDGLGLGAADPARNPIHSGVCPCLERLLRERAVPLDARLGIEGFPQSATGQTALLTGVNAAAAVGRHVEGFPGAALKRIIEERNVLRELVRRGWRATFANAYFIHDLEEVRRARRQSVTTVAALSALGSVRTAADLDRNEAVYQDLTRQILRERGYTGPLIAPREAADHLLAIASRYDLTLFEYFQTDRAGHAGDVARSRCVLSELDQFLERVLDLCAARGFLFVLTSDHGNIEDLSGGGHTLNPVPFAAVGPGADELQRQVKHLTDVAPALLRFWPDRKTKSLPA
jgi:hypothetical protein